VKKGSCTSIITNHALRGHPQVRRALRNERPLPPSTVPSVALLLLVAYQVQRRMRAVLMTKRDVAAPHATEGQ